MRSSSSAREQQQDGCYIRRIPRPRRCVTARGSTVPKHGGSPLPAAQRLRALSTPRGASTAAAHVRRDGCHLRRAARRPDREQRAEADLAVDAALSLTL